MTEIADLLHEGSAEEACRRVHALKGAAGNLGLQAEYEAASELDALLRRPPYDTSQALFLLSRLDRAFTDIATVLDAD